jgi:biotin-(acetyl-CoA carboxylase) ligase
LINAGKPYCYEGFHSLESDYLNRLYGLGKARKFGIDGKISNGIIRGIDSSGRLVVSMENEHIVFSVTRK